MESSLAGEALVFIIVELVYGASSGTCHAKRLAGPPAFARVRRGASPTFARDATVRTGAEDGQKGAKRRFFKCPCIEATGIACLGWFRAFTRTGFALQGDKLSLRDIN